MTVAGGSAPMPVAHTLPPTVGESCSGAAAATVDAGRDGGGSLTGKDLAVLTGADVFRRQVQVTWPLSCRQ